MAVTPAVRVLRAHAVAHTEHAYRYEEKGGTRVSSRELGVDEHQVIKTLVMQTDDRTPLVVLMHGDCSVSTRALARQIGARAVSPCDPAIAERHSGYQVGGTSPFGLRTPMPIYIERSILALPRLFINGGRRGFLVSLTPDDLARVLSPTPVDVAQPMRPSPDRHE
jgi:Cys-tRNA(Pro) deacylase